MKNNNAYYGRTPDWIKPYLDAASAKWGIPTLLLSAQISQESGFNPNAVSPAGAKGISQFIDSTAKAYGVNQFDVQSSIEGQAHFMSDLIKRHGTEERALSAYNSGRPDAYLDPKFAKGETFNYVNRVMSKMGKTAQRQSPITGAQAPIAQRPVQEISSRVLAYGGPTRPNQPQSQQPQPGGSYAVAPGDTLWGLAQKYLGSGSRWREIAGYGGNPRQLPIGTKLNIPSMAPQTPPTFVNKPPGSIIGSYA